MAYTAGARVKITGLQARADLNGETGLVLHLDEEAGRYEVILLAKKHDGQHIRLKPDNMIPMSKGPKWVQMVAQEVTGKVAVEEPKLAKAKKAAREAPSKRPVPVAVAGEGQAEAPKPQKRPKTDLPQRVQLSLHEDINALVKRICDVDMMKRHVESCGIHDKRSLSVDTLTSFDIKQGLTWLRAIEQELLKIGGGNPESLTALSQSCFKALGLGGPGAPIVDSMELMKAKARTLETLADIESTYSKILKVAAGGGKKKVESSDSEDEEEEESEAPKSRRPITPFFRFLGERREAITAEVRSESPDVPLRPTVVVKRASEVWKAMSETDRAPYEDPFKAEKAAYDQERSERKAKEDAEAWEADPLNERQYRMLNSQLTAISRGSPVWSTIAESALGTQMETVAPDGHFVSVERMFSLNRPSEEKAWIKSGQMPNRRLLWYGGPLATWAGVLSNGLRLPQQETPFSGFSFGKGIYFSDMVSVAASASGAGDDGRAIVLMCEVAMGKSVERTSVDAKGSSKLPPGKTSTIGRGRLAPSGSRVLPDGAQLPLGPVKEQPAPMVPVAGARLPHNEYVVYSTGHVRMRYLLEVRLISGSSQEAIAEARAEAQSLASAAAPPLVAKRLSKKTASDQTLLTR